MKGFSGPFADRLAAYVELQRALGYQFEGQVGYLRAFNEYALREGYRPPLTQDMAVAFATHDSSSSTDLRARRYRAVRRFSEYLRTFDPQTPILDPDAVRHPRARASVHILTDEELARLLHEARHISSHYPVRGVTLHAMVGLGASTGLRISEVVRLDKADVDLATGMLFIRKTKFKKQRYVPTHPSTLEVMRHYAALRDCAFPDCRDPAFFLTVWQRRFRRNTLQQSFCELARRAGLRPPTGRGIGWHHLRHRFAVKRLVTWYQAGFDVQAMLPMLATYLGHVHYSDTAYYLTATAELLGWAAERFQRQLESRSREVPS